MQDTGSRKQDKLYTVKRSDCFISQPFFLLNIFQFSHCTGITVHRLAWPITILLMSVFLLLIVLYLTLCIKENQNFQQSEIL